MTTNEITKREDDTLATAGDILHVVFRVAEADYMLPGDVVLQIEAFTGATPVPGAPPFVAGIVQVRGRVVPVVDLRLRFGLESAPIGPDSRVVVGQHGERVVGLLADAAREVLKIPRDQVKPPPPIVRGEAGGFVEGVAQIGKRVVMLIDFAKIIGEESLDGVGER